MHAFKDMKAMGYQSSVEIKDTTNWGNEENLHGKKSISGALKGKRLSKEFVLSILFPCHTHANLYAFFYCYYTARESQLHVFFSVFRA